jgi:hypothetical protein
MGTERDSLVPKSSVRTDSDRDKDRDKEKDRFRFAQSGRPRANGMDVAIAEKRARQWKRQKIRNH